jgi:RNA polymerase sigma factor (sigma-70 family)
MATPPLSETLQRLWAGLRHRQQEAFSQLYRLTYNDLLNLGLYVGHSAGTTKDAVNQLYAELWERADTLPDVANVRAYLFTYLRRKLLRDYEYNCRFTELTDPEAVAELSYEEVIVQAQQQEQMQQHLRHALTALTPRQRELIRLRFFENMTNEAIASSTGMHINTVYNTLSLALKGLRQRIGHS